MKVSVFTPTHSARHLSQAYASLLAQTHADWEWLVLPQMSNGLSLLTDPRVRVFDRAASGLGIGFYKSACCSEATGDVLLELDHDDVLEPSALASIAAAADPEKPQFLYSDCATFRDTADGVSGVKLSESRGFTSYTVATSLGDLPAALTLPAVPHNLVHVASIPNHLRAWTRKGYEQSGGYSAEWDVGDDHDLVLRSWLRGLDFVHVPECLYLYRIHADNSWAQVSWRIFELTSLLRRRYLDSVCIEYARRTGFAVGDSPDVPGTLGYFVDERPARRGFDDWRELCGRLTGGGVAKVTLPPGESPPGSLFAATELQLAADGSRKAWLTPKRGIPLFNEPIYVNRGPL